MKLSIVIPVYNEEKAVETIIDKIKAVELSAGMQKEIIIVDDGSTDKTRHLLQKYCNDPGIRVFLRERNEGKASALAFGIDQASGDIVMIQDADLEYDPKEYPNLLAPLLANQADVVYGSRFKGTIKDMLPINRLANIISNKIFTLLYFYPLTDINTCFKVFRRNVLEGIVVESEHFEFETEITAKIVNRGYKILEVPVDYIARTKQDGKKISWAKALKMFWGIFKYRFAK